MRKQILLLALAAGLAAPATAQSSFSVDDYWNLTKARLELATKEWQDRVTSAQQAAGDRAKLLAGSASVTKQYAALYSELCTQYGIDQQSYLAFPATHSSAVDVYLEENTELKRTIEGLQQQIMALMQSLDSITQPILARDPQ